MAHKFDPAHMARLETEDRRRSLDPEAILARLGLKAGDTFLDLGCGPGFFSLPAARIVGPNGRVHAVDVSPAMVERVQARAREGNLPQLSAVVSRESHVPLDDGVANLVLLANVLHEAEDPRRFLQEARRLTAPGGYVAVVEWNLEQTESGPPLAHRLAPGTVRQWLEETPPRCTNEFAVGPCHYCLMAERDA